VGKRAVSRRDFLRISGGAGAGLFFVGQVGGQMFRVPVAAAQDAGEPLDPSRVTKYATALLIPPAMPRAGTITQRGGKRVDYYEVSMRQFAQQILPAGMPRTTVWGYGAVSAESKRGLLLHNAPSLTIEAQYNRPVRVKWINDLVDDDGNHLPHLLPVDPTLHWANPPGGEAGRDTRPAFESTPEHYTGPVPIVTHAHGAVGVGDESDGYAEAWYLPDCAIPNGYASEGTWYEFFAAKAAASYGANWGKGFATFQYPNLGRATTNWYHDHTLGMTRLNVYAGPAGFFIVRGGPSGDGAVLDIRTGLPASFPGPAPRENDMFPPNKPYREIAIAIQDRSFKCDGSLFYPDTRALFDEFEGPYIPDTDISPIWNPEFFGNSIIVNGNTWPFQTVEQRRYRFRVLNGCDSRFLILDFDHIDGVELWAIGNEGGFLAAPVNLTATNSNRLLIGPAERSDLIVDFTNVAVGNYVLANVGPDEPFGGGIPGIDFVVADPATTGQVMEFRVVPALTVDDSTPPQFLQLPTITPLPAATVTTPLALLEEMSAFHDGPAEALLGVVSGDPNVAPGVATKRMWHEEITENPAVGATEVWEFYNATEDAHPMHIHETTFEVVNRQPIVVSDGEDEPLLVQVMPDSTPTPPESWETGLKDTVIAYPGQVTRVKAQFNNPGQYVWHCHIIEHEDNEMMRPYRIGPVQPGQPG
jgi:FtsP/CotA-like multicopper oxidase with cupredoxin domain